MKEVATKHMYNGVWIDGLKNKHNELYLMFVTNISVSFFLCFVDEFYDRSERIRINERKFFFLEDI